MSIESQTQEEIIKEQVAAKAKQAATVAAASGNIVRTAFLSTVTEAKTVGEKAVVFGSLGGIVSFFLPWITIVGTLSGSGLRLALHISVLFWLFPASMAFSFISTWLLLNAEPQKRILAARWFIVIGTLWVGPMVAAVSTPFSGGVGVGVYLALASSAAILIGGFLQIHHWLQKVNSNVD